MNRLILAVISAFVVLSASPRSAAADSTSPAPPGAVPTETAPAPVPPSDWTDKLYFGGGVGLSFGDVDYVELSPLVGYQLNPRISFGLGAFYRWASDDRYSPSVDTSDYGGSVFSRINIVRPIYAHIEYEYANYEYPTFSGSTVRAGDSNVLVGAGIAQPMGGRGGFYATALYNLTYDSDDPTSPYDSPWVYRVGFTFGF